MCKLNSIFFVMNLMVWTSHCEVNYMQIIWENKLEVCLMKEHVCQLFLSDIRLFQSFCQTRDRYKHILQTLPLWKSHFVDIDDSWGNLEIEVEPCCGTQTVSLYFMFSFPGSSILCVESVSQCSTLEFWDPLNISVRQGRSNDLLHKWPHEWPHDQPHDWFHDWHHDRPHDRQVTSLPHDQPHVWHHDRPHDIMTDPVTDSMTGTYPKT